MGKEVSSHIHSWRNQEVKSLYQWTKGTLQGEKRDASVALITPNNRLWHAQERRERSTNEDFVLGALGEAVLHQLNIKPPAALVLTGEDSNDGRFRLAMRPDIARSGVRATADYLSEDRGEYRALKRGALKELVSSLSAEKDGVERVEDIELGIEASVFDTLTQLCERFTPHAMKLGVVGEEAYNVMYSHLPTTDDEYEVGSFIIVPAQDEATSSVTLQLFNDESVLGFVSGEKGGRLDEAGLLKATEIIQDASERE